MRRGLANSLLLLAALIWGSAFVAQSTAMDSMGPLLFTGLRFLLAAAVVLPFALIERRRAVRTRSRKVLFQRVALGVVFFLAIATQQAGLVFTSVTNAGFLTAIYVVLVPVVARLFLKHRIKGRIWAASAVTLIGIWLLGGSLPAGLNKGDALVILCAVFWAAHVVMIGAVSAGSGQPVTAAVTQFLVAGVLGTSLGLLIEGTSFDALAGVWRELAYTGVLSGGLAFTLQAIGQRYAPASDAAIILSSESLFAALFGVWLLGDRLPLMGWAGCGLLLAAMLAVQLQPVRPQPV